MEYGDIYSPVWWNRDDTDTTGASLETSNFPDDSSSHWIWSSGLNTDAEVYSKGILHPPMTAFGRLSKQLIQLGRSAEEKANAPDPASGRGLSIHGKRTPFSLASRQSARPLRICSISNPICTGLVARLACCECSKIW